MARRLLLAVESSREAGAVLGGGRGGELCTLPPKLGMFDVLACSAGSATEYTYLSAGGSPLEPPPVRPHEKRAPIGEAPPPLPRSSRSRRKVTSLPRSSSREMARAVASAVPPPAAPMAAAATTRIVSLGVWSAAPPSSTIPVETSPPPKC